MTKAILAILIVTTIIQLNVKAYGAEPVFSAADNNKQIADKIIGTRRSDKSYEEYLQSNSDLNFLEWESQKQQRRKNVGIALTAVGGSMAIVGGTLALTVPRSCDEGDLECSLKSFIITAGTSGISVLAIMVPGIILTILSNPTSTG
ncbi:MAG: hypothetical protein JXR91_05460 [Deltaproteobacteria bacterium]|nr:hypothetical protein [Deltaproteobacteria bacterium]